MAISPSDKRLQRHATAITYVCINWSWLEQIVDIALSYFINQGFDSVEAECVVANVDLGDKLKIPKASRTIESRMTIGSIGWMR